MRRRVHAAFLSMMVAAAIHRRDGDPRQPRRVQIEVNDEEEDVLLQHVAELHSPFPTIAELHDILQIPPAPSCINDGRPLSPVRLVDGRWVNADETTPERRHTAADEHPGAGYRNFPCLPLPDPPPPAQEEEMAPWDDPTAMPYDEELAELIGL